MSHGHACNVSETEESWRGKDIKNELKRSPLLLSQFYDDLFFLTVERHSYIAIIPNNKDPINFRWVKKIFLVREAFFTQIYVTIGKKRLPFQANFKIN